MLQPIRPLIEGEFNFINIAVIPSSTPLPPTLIFHQSSFNLHDIFHHSHFILHGIFHQSRSTYVVVFHQSRFNLYGDFSSNPLELHAIFLQSPFDLHCRFFINTDPNGNVIFSSFYLNSLGIINHLNHVHTVKLA